MSIPIASSSAAAVAAAASAAAVAAAASAAQIKTAAESQIKPAAQPQGEATPTSTTDALLGSLGLGTKVNASA